MWALLLLRYVRLSSKESLKLLQDSPGNLLTGFSFMGYSHHMMCRFCGFCEFTVVSGNKLMTLLSLTVSVD
jgi:hypothetical protein